MLLAITLASVSGAAALVDPLTGSLKLDRAVLSATLRGDLPSAAGTWALSKRAALGLPPASTLVNAESFGTRFGASFHLQQQLAGIEVYGARAVVTVDTYSRVVMLSSSVAGWSRAKSTWLIDRREAIA